VTLVRARSHTHTYIPGAEPVSLRGIDGARTALSVASTSMRSVVCVCVCVCVYWRLGWE
jgi:hypothetical protein